MKTLEQLKKDLTNLNLAISKFESKMDSYSGSKTNPAGDFGGIRSQSRRTKERRMDATIDTAVKLKELRSDKSYLERKIYLLEHADQIQFKKLVMDYARLLGWKNLKIGDTIQPGNNVLTITKKNKFSLTAGNCNWSILEIYGIDSKRAKEVEDQLGWIETPEELAAFYKEKMEAV